MTVTLFHVWARIYKLMGQSAKKDLVVNLWHISISQDVLETFHKNMSPNSRQTSELSRAPGTMGD